jgi:sulfide:quinone oxidoreductase
LADFIITTSGSRISVHTPAYELLPQLRKDDRLTMISQGAVYHFVPSNPWVAIGWRKRNEIEVDLNEIMKRKGIRLLTQGAKRVHPTENRIELGDDASIDYDYLVLAANPGPVVIGAVQGASCFGPAYEFLFIFETELRRRKLRDRVPMTFVTSEPYIGHLGLDGVGDTKSLLESEMREKHIKWITNARVDNVKPGIMSVEEFAENGTVHKAHELPFAYSMMLPAFRGVGAVRGIEKLTNPRGFVIVDKHQRNPAFPNIFAVGVCVAIAPIGATPVPVGVPKTGFMIESMVTATAMNIGALLRGRLATAEPTWNAICLADFGDSGVAFLAQPQIPPRNVNWSSKGEWVHYAKVAFEKYFLRKMRRGESEPFYERFVLDKLNIAKIKEVRTGT